MSFVPHTPQERAEMLAAVGVASLDDLFADIPPALRLQGLEMPDGLAEQEVYDHLHALSHRNTHDLTSFLGAGFYDHTIPAAVDSLVARGEFSIVIAGLAVSAGAVEGELAALATAYVLLMAVLGPIAARVVEPAARLVTRQRPSAEPTAAPDMTGEI